MGALFTLVRAPKRGRYVGETSCPASADGEGALPGLTRVFRLTKMGSYLSYPCTGTDDTGRLQRYCQMLWMGKRAHPRNSGCLLHLAVDECDTLDDLGDELVPVEPVPVFLRIGGQFEYHGEGGCA